MPRKKTLKKKSFSSGIWIVFSLILFLIAGIAILLLTLSQNSLDNRSNAQVPYSPTPIPVLACKSSNSSCSNGYCAANINGSIICFPQGATYTIGTECRKCGVSSGICTPEILTKDKCSSPATCIDYTGHCSANFCYGRDKAGKYVCIPQGNKITGVDGQCYSCQTSSNSCTFALSTGCN